MRVHRSSANPCASPLRILLSKIHPVDRSLVIFMAVLLLQSAYSLFAPQEAGNAAGDIDIIIRTSSAAIFGYFLSANFIQHMTGTEEPVQQTANRIAPVEGEPLMASSQPEQAALSASDSSQEGAEGETEEEASQELPAANCLQVVVAAGIGLFCLAILLVLRNTTLGDAALAAQPERVTATVAQFRDFVSGCVGFLIGSPTHRSASSQS